VPYLSSLIITSLSVYKKGIAGKWLANVENAIGLNSYTLIEKFITTLSSLRKGIILSNDGL